MRMIASSIVVVSGLPSSGKSTLAARLRELVPLPLLAKDTIKEQLFDELGVRDREWSRQLSRAAYALMFAQAEELARCGQGCILEGNFRWSDQKVNFERLQSNCGRLVQVHCYADAGTLLARFRQRAASGTRHPGHVDLESLAEIEQELQSDEQSALPLDGLTLRCDTTGDWRAAIDAAAEAAAQAVRTQRL